MDALPRQAHADPELTTARLTLRRPTPDDITAIYTIHSDPATCLHNPSDALTTPGEAEDLFHRWNAQWQRSGYGYWVVRHHGSDQQLGFCGLKTMKLNGMRVLNLFYRFAVTSWGRGVAGEAATAVVEWASLNVPDLPVIARIRPANLASHRVAVRAGLARVERLDTMGEDGPDWIFATNLPT